MQLGKHDRRNYYVYAHRAGDGTIFYIGRGTGRRAWSTDRHVVWQRYVSERLKGKYSVEILESGLTEEQAEDRESMLIQQHGPGLVNWANPGRDFDYAAIEEFHRLRGENRVFLAETLPIEDADPATAVARYLKALDNLRAYEALVLERGVVAELSDWPKSGEPQILYRLTECLLKLGRVAEAQSVADKYFDDFPAAQQQGLGKRVLKKLGKATSGSLKVRRSTKSSGQSRKRGPARLLVDEQPFNLAIRIPKDQVERNLQGKNLERGGFVDNAIAFYEANVRDGCEGNFPYDRLAVIYRRRGKLQDEIRVLQRAIQVFGALRETSPRADVPLKLAAFMERLHVAKLLTQSFV